MIKSSQAKSLQSKSNKTFSYTLHYSPRTEESMRFQE